MESLRRAAAAALAAALILVGLSTFTAGRAHADPLYPQYDPAYGWALQACRVLYNTMFDYGTSQPTLHADDSFWSARLVSDGWNVYTTNPGNQGDVNFFNYTNTIDQWIRFGSGSQSGFFAADAALNNDCSPILPQVGDPNDYVTGNYEYGRGDMDWPVCEVLTWGEDSGLDVQSIMDSLSNITGIKMQKVSGIGDINVHWTSGTGGYTAWGQTANNFFVGVDSYVGSANGSLTYQVEEHELGHAIGMSHGSASNPSQNPPGADEIMHWFTSSSSPATYNAGDITGLMALGLQGERC